jgi:23S rRNA C2498 (ribose-2'-O)-methylase RlmM
MMKKMKTRNLIVKSGEFNRVPVPETVNLLIGMLIGVLRQGGLGLEEISDMRDVMVDFCRRSLVCLRQACQELK